MEDFRRNFRDNKFILLLCIINLTFSSFLYGYRKYPEKTALIDLIEKILVPLVTVFASFKFCCTCKKKNKEEQIIENGTSYLGIFAENQKLVEQLNELKTNGNKDVEKLVSAIKKEA